MVVLARAKVSRERRGSGVQAGLYYSVVWQSHGLQSQLAGGDSPVRALVILHIWILDRARIIGAISLYNPVKTSSSKYNDDVISSSRHRFQIQKVLSSVFSTPVCVSLDEPEPVDSVLTFLSGYDTLEYSWVKATAVSMRLQILFVTLQSTNNSDTLSTYMMMTSTY